MRERQAKLNSQPVQGGTVLEPPLTVKEAARLWGQSEKATRRYFSKVPGVRIIGKSYRFDPRRKRHVRKYETLLIPPSVLELEIRRTTKTAA